MLLGSHATSHASGLHASGSACDRCHKLAVDFAVKFNSIKSVFMRVGERYNSLCEPLRLFGTVLQQVQQMKYLSVCLVSDKKLKCDGLRV